jgi:hypothetical protein
MPFKPKPKDTGNKASGSEANRTISHETREMQKPPEKITKHDSGRFKESQPNVTHQADIFFIPKARQRTITLRSDADRERFGGQRRVKASHALIVQDIGTRKFDIKWIPNKTADAAAKAIKQIYKEGILKRPRFRFMTDKGKEFQADFTKFVEGELKVRHVQKDGDYSHLGVIDRKIAQFRKDLNTQQNDYEEKFPDEDFDWESARRDFIKETNRDTEERFEPEYKKTGKVLIEKEKHAEILPIGTKVKRYIQSDYVRDELGDLKKQIGTKRSSSFHWTRHNYVIVNVLLNPDSPPRYILKREGAGFKAENEDPVHYKHVKPLKVFKQG